MFAIANLVYAIAVILNIVVIFFMVVLIIDGILSFILPYGFPLRRIFDEMSDPILRPFRRWIHPFGYIDFTPFVVFLILVFIQLFVVNSLFDFSVVLRR
ncbi:MAG: YggT family protein [Mesoaciditoga sp.]|uniref:YggT family protein n=1 Tax=Athalassotoga sp. TaxID=2022597 RepID=UPI000CA956F6|nr:MAG: YggT family protein [Mesoaciditoga sp.]HEU23872.1 YggT family protein [Mesoaciditoga lauensis]